MNRIYTMARFEAPGCVEDVMVEIRCPECGKLADDLYFAGGMCVGCDNCITVRSACEVDPEEL